jgi:hypothetical protein
MYWRLTTIALGWALTNLVVAGFTSLVRRDQHRQARQIQSLNNAETGEQAPLPAVSRGDATMA